MRSYTHLFATFNEAKMRLRLAVNVSQMSAGQDMRLPAIFRFDRSNATAI